VPRSPGASFGLVETNALDGLIKLHTKVSGTKADLFQLLPVSGAVLVTLELGASCAIGNKIDITGLLFLKDSFEAGLKESFSHVVEEGPLTALKFGANPLKVDGQAIVSLAGFHLTQNFSGIAS
jgi:hypothetical protein